MTEPQRERLAARQAELLRALLAGGQPPPGFDPQRLRVEADALLAKRKRVVAALRPDVADALGARFGPLFTAYARARPRRDGIRGRADAAAFAAWLTERGELKPARRRLGRRLRSVLSGH
jgi:hypothetical protein